MVTKMQKPSSGSNSGSSSAPPLGSSVKDSAQHIWQAGLGAFSKAQAEGGKMFETLMKESVSMQRKTQSAAEDKITEATSKMAAMANDIGSKATGQWGKLEDIFEERVSKALGKLGVPSARDVAELHTRIAALEAAAGKPANKAVPKAPAKASAKAPAKAAANPVAKRSRRASAP